MWRAASLLLVASALQPGRMPSFDSRERFRMTTSTRADVREREQRSNRDRAAKFVSWAVATFGVELLRSGGVIDVAGGAGHVAYELAVRRGVSTTVVDPRTIKLSKPQRRRSRRQRGGTAALALVCPFCVARDDDR